MRKLSNIICVTATTLLLSGCGLYTSYKRPDIKEMNDMFRCPDSCNVARDSGMSAALISWRDFFTDRQLVTLIDSALRNNSDLSIAKLRVDEAEATLQASRSSFFPSVYISGQGGITKFNSSTSKTYSVCGNVDWELDVFSRKRNTKLAAQAGYEAMRAYQQAVQTQLVATVANSYYTLLMLDEQLRISRQTLANWNENIRSLTALKRAGKVKDSAIQQAKANRYNVEGHILTLQKQRTIQENALCSLLGITSQGISRSTLANQAFDPDLSTGVPMALLANRPDVRQAEYAFAESFYQTNVARSAFYPSLSLSGAAGWTNNGGGGITNPGDFLLKALGSLIQPILNQGTNAARLKIAKAQQEERMITFRQTLLDAGMDVNNALIVLQTAKERQVVDKQQIECLQKAVRNTQLLMKHTSANYLEVLTAQQNLLQAELTEATDRYDEIQGFISLYHALGGGS